jgi:hypothetical protein
MALFQPDSTPILIYSPWPKAKTNSRKYLAWPILAYKVLAPKPVQRKVNVFQKAVLGLCRAGKDDLYEISSYLQLDGEIVRFILSELRQAGYIDGNNKITGIGNQLWLSDIERPPTSEEIVSGYIFQDPWSGKLWPRIVPEIKFANSERRGNSKYPRLILGTEGSSKPHYLEFKHYTGTIVDGKPTVEDIIRASWHHEREKKIDMAFDNDEIFEDLEPHFDFTNPIIQQVEILSTEPDAYYVVTSVFTPSISPDTWSVWDPIGLSASWWLQNEILAQSKVDARLSQFLDSFFQTDQQESVQKQEQRTLALLVKESIKSEFGLDANLQPFFERLYDLEIRYQDATNRETPRQDQLESIVMAMGKLLENIFTQLNSDWLHPTCWKDYDLSDKYKRQVLLNSLIVQVGFDKISAELFPSPRGNDIRYAIETGRGTLKQKIVIAILSAYYRPDHPLRRISRDIPDLWETLFALISDRNASAHDAQVLLSKDEVKKYRHFLYKILNNLVPSRGD